MKIDFINYNGIEQYARVMYNDVKDSDKYKVEVAYNGKDIKALLEYLFELEQKNKQLKDKIKKLKDYGEAVGERRNQLYDKIDKAIEHIKKYQYWNGNNYNCLHCEKLLEILGDKE